MAMNEIEQLQHATQWSDVIDLEFFATQIARHVLEHRDIRAILVAEVVVEHARVGSRTLAHRIDPCAAGAAVTRGEFAVRGSHIAQPPGRGAGRYRKVFQEGVSQSLACCVADWIAASVLPLTDVRAA